LGGGCLIAGAALFEVLHGKTQVSSFAMLAMGIGLIDIGARRVQLREAGLWNAGRLIPWDKIEGYEITTAGSLSLKTPAGDVKCDCDVPPALRQQAEELLGSKCRVMRANREVE
jgi:hypothetical protein